jgi:ABC-type glycerol-3-phosphate transport system substrate-binding protein
MKLNIRLILAVCLVGFGASMIHTPAKADTSVPAIIKMPDKIAGGRPVTFTITGMPPDTDVVKRQEWNDQVARFQKLYPNVTVSGSEYSYDPQTFPAKVAAKQVPTLFQVYLTDPGKYIDSGVAADITSIFNANKLGDIYNPDLIRLVSKGDKVYGLPDGAYAMGLGYNIQMLKDAGFDKPPATWDELRKMAKALTHRDAGVSGFSMINDAGPATGWHFTVISYTFGATPGSIIARGADGKYSAGFGAGPTVDALNLIKNLRWTDDALPHDTLDWAGNGTALATGKAAMAMMAGDQYVWMKTTYRDTDMKNFAFAPLPAGPAGIVSLTGGDTYLVSSDATDDQKEAGTYFALWRLFDPNEVKLDLEAQKNEENAAIGGPYLPLYVGDYQKARFDFSKPYFTLPYDNFSGFLDAISSGKVKLQVEPTPAGQEYYQAVASVVSTILTDQSADPAASLKTAAQTFQTTQLDRLGMAATAAATAAK